MFERLRRLFCRPSSPPGGLTHEQMADMIEQISEGAVVALPAGYRVDIAKMHKPKRRAKPKRHARANRKPRKIAKRKR